MPHQDRDALSEIKFFEILKELLPELPETRFAEVRTVLGPIVRREIAANRVDEWKEYVSKQSLRASERIAVLSREMAMWEQRIPPKYRK